jgi:NTE family protein
MKMNKPIRVALSGSGFRFPAHVGALMAIRDAGYTPVEYAGTSGGSIIAALAASGMDLDTMKNITMNNDWSMMLSMSFMSLIKGNGYCDGQILLDWITENTKGVTFEKLPTSLVIMSSDITNAVPFKWSKETTPEATIALAARASASIPFVYTPVKHQGAGIIGDVYSVDGGVENNLPVMKLVQDAIPRIGIDLTSKETAMTTMNPLTIGERLLSMMLGAAESTQALFGQYSGAQIAYVESGYASSLDRNMSLETRRRLLADGHETTLQALCKLP